MSIEEDVVAATEDILKQTQGGLTKEALVRLRPELVEDLKVHKPYIDAVSYASPFAVGARMKRASCPPSAVSSDLGAS